MTDTAEYQEPTLADDEATEAPEATETEDAEAGSED